MTVQSLAGGKSVTNSTVVYSAYCTNTPTLPAICAARFVAGTDLHFIDSGDPDFTFYQVNTSPPSDATSAAVYPSDGLVYFRVSTNALVNGDATKPGLLMVTVAAGSDQVGVPIATVSGSTCTAGPCVGPGDFYLDGKTRYIAAAFADPDYLDVGVYVTDICNAAKLIGGATPPAACVADPTLTTRYGIIPQLTETSPPSIDIKFVLGAAKSTSVPTTAAFKVTDVFEGTPGETQTVALKFGGKRASSGCTRDGSYFPGDGAIIVNTDAFTVSTAGTHAPMSAVLVAAQRAGNPAYTTYALASASSVFGRAVFPGARLVSGFANATSASDTANAYNLQFLPRDSAGVVVATDATFPNTCSLQGVRTADIQGYLTQGKCFVATAVFQDPDHPAVNHLRRFRDRVLLRSAPGRALAAAYYAHGPRAADWVLEHPRARPHLLAMFIPLLALVTLLLNPGIAVALAAGGILVGWRAARATRR